MHRRLKNDPDKAAYIAHLSNVGRPLRVQYDPDAPPPDDLHHAVLGDGRYVLYPPFTYEAIARWLHLGNWQAIQPAESTLPPIDTFRVTEEQVAARMRAAGVSLLIDSWHDDTEWNVYLT